MSLARGHHGLLLVDAVDNSNVVWTPTGAVGPYVLSDSNKLLTATSGSTGVYARVRSERALTGKSYVSGLMTLTAGFGVGNAAFIGADATHWPGDSLTGPSYSVGMYVGSDIYYGGSKILDGGAGASPLGMEMAIDVPNRKVWLRETGQAWPNSGDPVAGTNPAATLGGTDALYVIGLVYSLSPAGRSMRIHTLSEITGTPPSGYTKANYAP